MSQIIDLDELLGDDKRVRLKGKVYTLPPDLPAEVYLRVLKLARDGASEAEMMEALYGQLLELFRYKQPNLKELPLTTTQCVFAVAAIYGTAAAEGDKPGPPRTRGSRSSKSRKTT